MLNPRLAGRYAKSLIDLAIERNQLEEVYNDILLLQSICRNSREFVTVLKSPVIAADKKNNVLDALTAGKVTDITAAFNRLLITKGREAGLPEMINAFIDQYKKHKHIHTITLTTATAVSDEVKQQIIDIVKKQTSLPNIELKAEVKEDIIGGFVLEVGDTLVDASVAYDLNKIRSQFKNNDFLYNIR